MKFLEQVSQETPANAGFCNQLSLENVSTKIYFLKNISFDLIFNGMCSQGLSVQQKCEDLSRCLSWWFVRFTSLRALFIWADGNVTSSLDYTQLFFLIKTFQGGGQHVAAQERINVRKTAGRKNNCKLNFFSMYFVEITKKYICLLKIADTNFKNIFQHI